MEDFPTMFYEISLSFIIEQTVLYLDTQSETGSSLCIIIEKRGAKEDKKLHEHFQKILSRGTGSISPVKLAEYQLSIVFKNKKENINGLQLADLIAYPIARHILEPGRINPAFNIFKEKFCRKEDDLYGLKVFP